MNERIRELAEQAGIVFWEISGDVDWRQANRENLEKFAELIVRECIAIVEPSSYRRAYPDNYRGGIDCMDTLDDRVEKIKEHFGVEE